MKTNAIYCGDSAQILATFPEESVDLIYLDPPFFSNKHYEVIWKDGAEVRAFEDRWKGGIENYVAWMEPKIRECHRILKPTGSMYLHCDFHANAHLRILMDKVFGQSSFQNEIVWWYSGGGASKRRWAGSHDTIFFYTKTDSYTFNVDDVRVPYKTEWTRGQTRADGSPRTIHKGKLPDDVWQMHSLMPWAGERLGYPTQKPEALLERMIKASSNPMDIVLDPMCGCGTAIAVAHKLGRRWVGVDVSPTACKLMAHRMRHFLKFQISDDDIVGLPKTLEEVKGMQPFEFQNWVCERLRARVSNRPTGDMGIDGWIGLENVPLQVKQSEGVGRNVLDNFETALRRARKTRGVIVAMSFGRGAYEEAARAKNQDALEITLRSVEELI